MKSEEQIFSDRLITQSFEYIMHRYSKRELIEFTKKHPNPPAESASKRRFVTACLEVIANQQPLYLPYEKNDSVIEQLTIGDGGAVRLAYRLRSRYRNHLTKAEYREISKFGTERMPSGSIFENENNVFLPVPRSLINAYGRLFKLILDDNTIIWDEKRMVD